MKLNLVLFLGMAALTSGVKLGSMAKNSGNLEYVEGRDLQEMA